MNAINFFSTVGHHFRMAAMLNKARCSLCNYTVHLATVSVHVHMHPLCSVKQRLSSAEGMSFREFSYQTFQAYDYLHLSTEHECVLQVCGGGEGRGGDNAVIHTVWLVHGALMDRDVSGRGVYGFLCIDWRQ